MKLIDFLRHLYAQHGEQFFYVKSAEFNVGGLDDENADCYVWLAQAGFIKRCGTSYSNKYGHRQMLRLTGKGVRKAQELD